MLWRRRSLNSGQKTKQENLQQRHRTRSCPRLLSWWYRCCFSRRLIFDCLVCTSKDGVHICSSIATFTQFDYWTCKEKKIWKIQWTIILYTTIFILISFQTSISMPSSKFFVAWGDSLSFISVILSCAHVCTCSLENANMEFLNICTIFYFCMFCELVCSEKRHSHIYMYFLRPPQQKGDFWYLYLFRK